MNTFWSNEPSPAFWRAPAILGLLLIGMGALVVAFPEVFASIFAAALILIGVGLLGLAWRLRRSFRTTYRRIDREWRVRDDL